MTTRSRTVSKNGFISYSRDPSRVPALNIVKAACPVCAGSPLTWSIHSLGGVYQALISKTIASGKEMRRPTFAPQGARLLLVLSAASACHHIYRMVATFYSDVTPGSPP